MASEDDVFLKYQYKFKEKLSSEKGVLYLDFLPLLLLLLSRFSRVRLFATPWTVAYQAPLSVGFSRQ